MKLTRLITSLLLLESSYALYCRSFWFTFPLLCSQMLLWKPTEEDLPEDSV